MQYRHHLELTWLEDCVALKETLNFSKASAARYVTQPAFSRRIQSLEEWVGTPLFERSKRGVSLTKAGEVFIEQLPELIHDLYSLKTMRWMQLAISNHIWFSQQPMHYPFHLFQAC